MKRSYFGSLAGGVVFLCAAALAAVIRVPQDVPTIQQAIQAAQDGDTILVAPGTYVENIDFLGKAITVRSTDGPAVTILDGNRAGPVVTFQSGEGRDSMIDGFTVTKGVFVSGCGGGIRIDQDSSPTIINNTITGNRATCGGGIVCFSGSPLIAHNTITHNCVLVEGGGIGCSVTSSPTIRNNTISRNLAGIGDFSRGYGGGIFAGSDATIENNVITYNVAYSDNYGGRGYGGGIYGAGVGPAIANNTIAFNYCWYGTQIAGVVATNCIIWNSFSASVVAFSTVTFSDVRGGHPGTGNIDADPQFLDPAGGDFRIACSSPCVDAGTNSPPDLQGNPLTLPPLDHEGRDLRIIGTIDMGADEAGAVWDFNGPAQAGGPPVHFTATATPAQNGGLAFVFVSLGDGGASGGIPLLMPQSFGRRLRLDPDGLFAFWFKTPPAIRAVVLSAGCAGNTTAPLQLPPTTPVGLTVFHAGITLDSSLSALVSVMETRSFVTQ